MKKNTTLSLFCFLFSLSAFSQSTALRVYQIFQDKCVACHSNADPQSGLDLEGEGATEELRTINVYQTLLGTTPQNTHAVEKGYPFLYPGRADRSFLFRKINAGLEETINMHTDELEIMPPYGQTELTDVEKELIRQWILFGAPTSGEVVSEQLLDDFYNLNGKKSFPDGPPPAPAPEEGFQIKVGPFYLNPASSAGDEVEYFTKYALHLEENVEVNRMDIKISGSSHHFIIYDFFNQSFANQVPAGFRLEPDHSGVGLVAAVQERTDLRLPNKTAFFWDKNLTLDLNSHYINYSVGNTYQAEAYVNIYTQPMGTAIQEMKTELYANTDIYIDNDENPHTDQQVVGSWLGGPNDEIYLWGIMGHTHKYGTGYKAWTREGGQKKELIYDAGCAEGVPECSFNSFDYQHIPMRYFSPLYPVKTGASGGLIHEASWLNDGPSPVWFGPSSNDEMMVLVMMYTTDTTGLISSIADPVTDLLAEVKVTPNPMLSHTTFEFPEEAGTVDLRLYDILGRELLAEEAISGASYTLDRGNLQKGMYVYQITTADGRVRSGKLLIEE